jgi:hypothetical protein
VDPVLGRIAAPADRDAPTSVVVRYRYGFSDTIGGGADERGEEIAGTASQIVSEASAATNLDIGASQEVELRAANGQRPTIRMSGGELVINGGNDATIVLNGLVLVGGTLRITGVPGSVTLRHCTLVPGVERTRQNAPAQPGAPSLIVEPDGVEVMIDRCITGPLCVANGSTAKISRSQLNAACDESIRRGADDESEIGVFHDLFQPQRESDLRTRLDEFLRFGMEAGIFYAS